MKEMYRSFARLINDRPCVLELSDMWLIFGRICTILVLSEYLIVREKVHASM